MNFLHNVSKVLAALNLISFLLCAMALDSESMIPFYVCAANLVYLGLYAYKNNCFREVAYGG